jgi:hypothetical protein
MIKSLIGAILIALLIVFLVVEACKLIVYGWFSKKADINNNKWELNQYSRNIIHSYSKDKIIAFCKMPYLHIFSKWYIMGSPNKQVFIFSKLHRQIEKTYKEVTK